MRTLLIVRAALAILVAFLYAFPQIAFTLQGHRGAVFAYADEPWYAARTVRAMQGDWVAHNPFISERATELGPVPALAETVIGKGARAMHVPVDTAIVLSRAVLPAVSFLLFAEILIALGLVPALALVASFWILTEPGLLVYKPFGPWLWNIRELGLDRYTNPLFSLPLFLLSLFFGARAYLSASRPRAMALGLAAGAALGATFYVSVYYWTHLALGFALAALLTRGRHRWHVLGAGAAAAAVVAIPYLILNSMMRGSPEFETFGWRLSVFVHDRGLYLLGHKTLWPALLIAIGGLLWLRTEGARVLLAFVLSGALLYFSPLLTGRSFQNFHYHYTIAPLIFAAAVWLPAERALALLRARGGAKALPAIAFGCVLLAGMSSATGVAQWSGAVEQNRGTLGASDQDYYEAWQWLRLNGKKEEVVVADERILELVPARSGLHSLAAHFMMSELMPQDEQLRRWQLLWALAGFGSEDIKPSLDAAIRTPVCQWIYGIPQSMLPQLQSEGYPPLCGEVLERIAKRILEEQDAMPRATRIAELRPRFRMDFLVRGPFEGEWAKDIDRYLTLEKVGQFGKVRIDRIRTR